MHTSIDREIEKTNAYLRILHAVKEVCPDAQTDGLRFEATSALEKASKFNASVSEGMIIIRGVYVPISVDGAEHRIYASQKISYSGALNLHDVDGIDLLSAMKAVAFNVADI